MALQDIEIVKVKRRAPIRLYITGGVEETGNANFGGYKIYCIKVDDGDDAPIVTDLNTTKQLELIADVVPEWTNSYSGQQEDDPQPRLNSYNSDLVYHYDYYYWENDKDHYFYLTAYDKDRNLNSGLIPHWANPVSTPADSYSLNLSSGMSSVRFDRKANSFWGSGDVCSGTICALIKPLGACWEDDIEFGEILQIADNEIYTSSPHPFRLYLWYGEWGLATGYPVLTIGNGSTNIASCSGSSYDMGPETLYHLTATFSYLGDVAKAYNMKLYGNGNLIKEETSAKIGAGDIAQGSAQALYIGKGEYSSGDGYTYRSANIAIKDCRIYDYPMTAAQISGLYSSIMSGEILDIDTESGLLFHAALNEGPYANPSGTLATYWKAPKTSDSFTDVVWSITGLVDSVENSRNPSKDISNYIDRFTDNGYMIDRTNLLPHKYSTFTLGEMPSGITGGYFRKKPTQDEGLHGSLSACVFETTDVGITGNKYWYFSTNSDTYNILFNSGIANKLLVSLYCKCSDTTKFKSSYFGMKSNTGESTAFNALLTVPEDNFEKFTYIYTPPVGTTACVLFIVSVDDTSTGEFLYIDNIQVEYDTKNTGVPMAWQPGWGDLSYMRVIPRVFDALGAASGIVSDEEMFYITGSGLFFGTAIPGTFFNATMGVEQQSS